MTKKATKKKTAKKKAATKRLDALRNKVRTKPKNKSTRKPKGKDQSLVSAKPETGPGTRQIERAAMEADVRQWVRYWAQAGWDPIEATAKMHPELKAKEIARIAEQYRSSPMLHDAMLTVMREIRDRLEITPDEAAEILSAQATTSVLDFFSDEGEMLTVREMRRLPRHKQLALKKLKVTETESFDKDGNHVSTKRQVEMEAYDIQNAIDQISRLRSWGMSSGERDLADLLKRAEARLHNRSGETIDADFTEIQEE